MADDEFADTAVFDALQLRTRDLETGAKSFSRAMTQAFASSVTGAKQFDDVLKSLALRLSDLALKLAFKPLEKALTGGLEGLLGGLFGGGGATLTAATGAIKPFASGGVIGAPTYFPLTGGGVGLAGEAGPEAIMPLRRGADGRLGVASQGAGSRNISIHIAASDLESFRKSENYITGQIARAVSRGQRSL